MNTEVAKALVKRSVLDFGVWLCRFDAGKPEVEKEKADFLKLRAKHEAVIHAWKNERGTTALRIAESEK